ncbi:uncharacterized protein LOC124363860 [Homalodisca vitripennis]|uniref:uncharacterized protein LOC124363860 n=1 Tax=Homalodisca vitripennis TaxID=197043 RepID=UPI001EEA7DDF|nr:uncharacterized protein LOC124363860 [Homalodisca vitripennis]
MFSSILVTSSRNLIFVLVLVKILQQKVTSAAGHEENGVFYSRGVGCQAAKITAIRVYIDTTTEKPDSQPIKQQSKQTYIPLVTVPVLSTVQVPFANTSSFVNLFNSAMHRITLFFTSIFSFF